MSEEQQRLELELLEALAQVGKLAERLLAARARGEGRSQRLTADPEGPPHASSESATAAPLLGSSRPGSWTHAPLEAPQRFFTQHAAERLQERFGTPGHAVVSTLSALIHQVRGTHDRGVRSLDLGKARASSGLDGTMHAVDLYGQVGFIVVSDEGEIVTVLPREPKQLARLTHAQAEELAAFRTATLLRSQQGRK